MIPEEISITEEEQNNYLLESKEVHFKTRFNFLRSHNGIRKNKMHLLLSPTSGGKSTAVRSIVRDFIFNNKNARVLVWLTEESKREFEQELCKTVPPSPELARISVVSEIDSSSEGEEIKRNLEQIMAFHSFDLVIVDNITTSMIYMDKRPDVQGGVSWWLKGLAKKAALLVIAHTNTGDTGRILSEQDIRGTKTICNIVEFLYVLQPVQVNNTKFQFINILKHRGQECDGLIYRLYYKKELMAFESDMKTDFDDFKEIFRLRNKL